MIELTPGTVGCELELGKQRVTSAMIRRYAEGVGDRDTALGPCTVAPPGFVFALRRYPSPEVKLKPDMLSVHGGHEIELLRTIKANETYRIRGQLTDVFEKSGRSGRLTVIVRYITIHTLDGIPTVIVTDREIVRKRPTDTVAFRPDHHRGGGSQRVPPPQAVLEPDSLDIGTVLGPEARDGPTAAVIQNWANLLGADDIYFTSVDEAHRLGFPDIIVPAPMQSAFLEQMLRRQLPGWRLRRFSLTFRVSVISGEPLTLSGVVTERTEQPDAVHLRCDLMLENAEHDRAATGTAELSRRSGA